MKITTGMNSQEPMKKYALIFAIAYLVNTIIIVGVSQALGAGGGAGLNIVTTIAPSLIVFGSENNDVLTKHGKADRLYGGAANATVWKEAA